MSQLRIYTAALVILCLALSAGQRLAAQRAELYQPSERAQALVVRLTGPNTEGAGVIFHIDQQYAYGFTAKHVVFRRGRVIAELKAQFRAWPSRSFDAAATRFHHRVDLAVFRVDLRSLGLSLPELRNAIPLDQLGASQSLDFGDELYTVGHAAAGAWITSKEPARFSRGEEGSPDLFLFEPICPRGHSGGGVFDGQWRLVGMMIDTQEPFCRALRVESVLRLIQSWKAEVSLVEPPPGEERRDLPQELKVAIVDFDNRSGEPMPDLGYVAQDVTSSFLNTVPGVVLATRDRLDAVRCEIGLTGTEQSSSGMSRMGRLLDVDALLTGSILRYDVERRIFQSFGTSALKDIYRMTISLQLLDVDTGRVRFAKKFDVERTHTYPKASSAPRQPVNRASELLEALLEQAEGEVTSALEQVAAGLGAAGQFVAIPVTSRPAGADVILNGVYMGSTPTTLELTLDVHDIAIELPGHQRWHRRVKIEPGMTVEVNLAPKLR